MNKKIVTIIIIILLILIGGYYLSSLDWDGNGQVEVLEKNRKLIQCAVNEYIREGCTIPAKRQVSFSNPSPIAFQRISSYFLETPDFNKEGKYWITENEAVYASTINAPSIEKSGDAVIWESIDGADYYNVYRIRNNNYSFVASTTDTSYGCSECLVSAVDASGNETAPVGTNYKGYKNQAPVVWGKDKEPIKLAFSKGFLASVRRITLQDVEQLADDPDGTVVDYEVRRD